MNIIKIIISIVVIKLLLAMPLGANASEEGSRIEYSEPTMLSETDLRSRVDAMDLDIDVRYTQKVREYIYSYVFEYKAGTERILGRSEVFFPIIEHEIEARELPEALKFLTIIESNLRPEVRSKAGAVGMWQFMKTTGQHYGLEVNGTIDQRKDFVSSTKAALNYLADLHARFGDWTLAIAAYNCGPGNMNKAIRRSGSRNYWELQNYLPRETRNYVPKFIAAAYLMNYYYLHGFTPEQPDQFNGEATAAKLFSKVSFKEISENSGVEIDRIKLLNPAYLKNMIPERNDGMFLLLPAADMYTLLQNHPELIASFEYGPFKDSYEDDLDTFVDFSVDSSTRDKLNISRIPALDAFIVHSSVVTPSIEQTQFRLISMDDEYFSGNANIPAEFRNRRRSNRF